MGAWVQFLSRTCGAHLSLSPAPSGAVLSLHQTHLHPGVDAHVPQEGPLGEGPQAGHAPASHPAQVAEVHVGGEVGGSRSVQDVVQLVAFKTLQSYGESVRARLRVRLGFSAVSP